MNNKLIALSAMALGLSLGGPAQAEGGRDYLSIVGSSTVYPFSSVVAEQFGKAGKADLPGKTGDRGGRHLRLICQLNECVDRHFLGMVEEEPRHLGQAF